MRSFALESLFDYTFEVDPDAASLLIPRMSIQPLVENACKHGLQARKNGREIKITARRNASELVIQVIDNGIGMDAGRLTEPPARYSF